jgi:hypothetical protein
MNPPDEVDEKNKKLINQFRKNRKAAEHDRLYQITPEEWKSFWKILSERTSWVCDILHFGTWKSGSFSETITELDVIIFI